MMYCISSLTTTPKLLHTNMHVQMHRPAHSSEGCESGFSAVLSQCCGCAWSPNITMHDTDHLLGFASTVVHIPAANNCYVHCICLQFRVIQYKLG